MKINSNSLPLVHRVDHDEIVKMISSGSRVLDLGCGDGVLLYRLKTEKNVRGEGVEIDDDALLACVKKGLNVYHGNLDDGLQIYNDQQFDYVILNETLQALRNPLLALKEMVRVGKQVIIGFPNFAYITVRSYLFFKGEMPKSKELPFEWYETPNIHLCTIKDFYRLCRNQQLEIVSTRFIGLPFACCFPNLLAKTAIFAIKSVDNNH